MINWYIGQGFALVPLHYITSANRCSCGTQRCIEQNGGGKHPIEKQWTERNCRTTGPWVSNPLLNVGIATGKPSGFFVLDEDPDHSGDARLADLAGQGYTLPRTRTHRTGSGGRHFLFAMPDDFEPTNRRGDLPVGLDIRGTGGQIVAPPSVSSKGPYVVIDDAPIAPAPDWLLDLIRPKAYEPPTYDGPAPDAPTGRFTAWAGARLSGRCADLAAAANGSRNETAMQVARDLVKLANAPWSGIEAGWANAQFHVAASSTGLPPNEAAEVWRKAVIKIGDQQEQPPADRPYEGSARSGPEVFTVDPATGAPTVADGPAPTGAPSGPAAPITLPETFWAAHPTLQHIRAAAHSRKRSADVALYSTLARLSAMWPHQLRVDTDVARPVSLNLFVAVVAPSGVGKSSGLGVAHDLLPTAPWLDDASFRDRVPLGSGEGLAETYMGSVEIREPVVGESGVEESDTQTGEPRTRKVAGKVRRQVRHNALFWLDEGEILTNMKDRAGQTIGATIRSAATGDTIGSANADTATRREVREGQYSAALVVGFQPAKMGPLFDDAGGGTPQRFVYVWAQDSTVPRTRQEAPQAPGPLEGVWKVGTGVSVVDGAPRFSMVEPGEAAPDLTPFTVVESIKDQLWNEDGDERAELDSHAPGTRVKLAGLLAALLGGREITEWHWAMADQMWVTSCAVRDHALSLSRARALDEQRARTTAHVERERLTKATLVADDEKRADAAVERVARRLATRVHGGGVPVSGRVLAQWVAGRDRAHRADAIAHAVECGWLIESAVPDSRSPDGESRAYAPGASRPS